MAAISLLPVSRVRFSFVKPSHDVLSGLVECAVGRLAATTLPRVEQPADAPPAPPNGINAEAPAQHDGAAEAAPVNGGDDVAAAAPRADAQPNVVRTAPWPGVLVRVHFSLTQDGADAAAPIPPLPPQPQQQPAQAVRRSLLVGGSIGEHLNAAATAAVCGQVRMRVPRRAEYRKSAYLSASLYCSFILGCAARSNARCGYLQECRVQQRAPLRDVLYRRARCARERRD